MRRMAMDFAERKPILYHLNYGKHMIERKIQAVKERKKEKWVGTVITSCANKRASDGRKKGRNKRRMKQTRQKVKAMKTREAGRRLDARDEHQSQNYIPQRLF